MRCGDGVASVRLVVLALAMCFFCLAGGERGQTFCGKALPQVLSLVCDGCYNTRDKKYIHNTIDDSYWVWASMPKKEDGDDLEDLEEAEHQPPFRDRLRAADMIGDAYKRFTRGVADECCHKQCSMSEVANYCCEKTARRPYS
ncbi:Insulin like peptide 1 [Frankliniella occidentalis]|uniref:Bombyxin A-1 homolog n=1 Tax=Frankliniella occidentalis TaxID=133901 RepID=A0A6J1SQ05_FRAOC|nr:bombyxin A-1 homolog [Frankliniella occidentalis]KAE8736969.1 Insulin like peptide 1 [Frankliniella occidentalis]